MSCLPSLRWCSYGALLNKDFKFFSTSYITMETIDHNSADESLALSHTDNAEVKNKTAETATETTATESAEESSKEEPTTYFEDLAL